ncbi:histidine--tRNA ligase [Candidatus Wolfebacteria bacterium]|nr:MAG: histidine--tRNA ligase [Candidatus Wolfebacteria bacterium]
MRWWKSSIMKEKGEKNLSTEPYKGVRDFYPESQSIQNYITDVWKATVESFGYQEYNASILEPSDLYRAKTGEEIVNEQTYTFTDRGDREVTLRPEMTPTVARMIAKKRKELSFPLRWYSTPNLFRYERPQRGRLREHTQLNVDFFGIDTIDAEIELISIASTLLTNFGMSPEQFEIRINDRAGMSKAFSEMGLSDDQTYKMYKLLDRKKKIDNFDEEAEKIIGAPLDLSKVKSIAVTKLIRQLNEIGITNVKYDPSIIRGFDYYTGIIFEVFDTSSENNRSLFGGGRYDNLLDIFGVDPVPTVGFGMGDVTIRDVLDTYGLLPEVISTTDLSICVTKPEYRDFATLLAKDVRAQGVNVSVNYSNKKVGDQIRYADNKKIPYITCIGDDEVKGETFKIKELATGKETEVTRNTVTEAFVE